MIVRAPMPRVVVIGDDERLDLGVFAEDSTQYAASAATVTIEVGGSVIHGPVPATVGGAHTAYLDLAASVTTGMAPSELWLEKWRVTIGTETRTFTRRGYLVRVGWQPSITDADLLGRHPDLTDSRKGIVPSGQTLQPYRQSAAETIARRLNAQAKRPWLIFDPSPLTEASICLALHYAFLDAKASIGDERYKELAAEYRKMYEAEFASVSFSYDNSETGILTDGATDPASAPLVITSGVPWPTRRYALRR